MRLSVPRYARQDSTSWYSEALEEVEVDFLESVIDLLSANCPFTPSLRLLQASGHILHL